MCIEWKSIERSIQGSVSRAGLSRFAELAKLTGLAEFDDAAAFLEYLHDRQGSDEERDHLLGLLVSAARGCGEKAELARDLLWLAFWPALTSMLRQLTSWNVEDEREVVSEISIRFSEALADLHLDRCQKVAVTLLWNTRRGVVETLKQRTYERRLQVRVSMDHIGIDAVHGDVMGALDEMRDVSPEEAALVQACVLEGVTTREFACRCGDARETVKKRLQRALGRLRTTLVDDVPKYIVPDRAQNPLIGGVKGEFGSSDNVPDRQRERGLRKQLLLADMRSRKPPVRAVPSGQADANGVPAHKTDSRGDA